MIRNILNNAQRASSSTSAVSHQTQQPTQVVSTNAATGPSSSVSTAELKTHHIPFDHGDQIPSSSVGQGETFQRVCNFLRDASVGMIGIYGMGGVGKTTLMERVHKEFLVTCNFDVIIWIAVSKVKDEARIQKRIVNILGLPYDQDATQHEQAIKINDKLCIMNFVMLIDDMWEHLDVMKLGIPDPTQVRKSKIIFTTRSEEVCDQMQPHRKVKVNCLGWDDAWILFKQTVGEKTLDSHPRIPDLAKQVAEECDRLPLALKVIGRAMASKHTPQQWEYAITILRNSPSEISGTEEKLFSSLKLSYDALPNPTIKECFLYCCLFPEDWSVDEVQLVNYWIGEGFLGIDENLIEARNRGFNYISTLKASFLLEIDRRRDVEVQRHDVFLLEVELGLKGEVKMHDVIRDMALWIVSDHGKEKYKFFVHPGFGLSKLQTAKRWGKAHKIFVWDSKEMPQLTECRILTLICDSHVRFECVDFLFNSMPLLRVVDLPMFVEEEHPAAIGQLVELRYLRIQSYSSTSWLGNLTKLEILDLSFTEVVELPNTIGQLVELRYLNLNGCVNLSALPTELGNCSKLEMLFLNGIYLLKKLPSTIGKLAEMRYLDINRTEITVLPEEFWELKNLEVLHFVGDNTVRFTAVELCKLAELKYLNSVKICVKELSSLTRLAHCLHGLWMHCCPSNVSMELLPLLEEMDKLSELRIIATPAEKIVAGAVSNINTQKTSLPCLEELAVSRCTQLSEIVVDELSLVYLRELLIFQCNKLKCIAGLHHLQHLEVLSIDSARHIEEVISTNDGTGGNICFPRLKQLTIRVVFRLKRICSDTVSFPSLQAFDLDLAHSRLEKLPLGLMNEDRTLQDGYIIGDSQQWWNELKWQDDNFKSFLLPYFKPLLW